MNRLGTLILNLHTILNILTEIQSRETRRRFSDRSRQAIATWRFADERWRWTSWQDNRMTVRKEVNDIYLRHTSYWLALAEPSSSNYIYI